MRRYLPLFWVTFFVLVIILAGSTYLASYADKQHPKNLKSIVVYTTLPVEQAAVLAQEYEKEQHIRVNFVPLSEQDILVRVKAEASAPQADILLTAQGVLDLAKKEGLLTPYTSEQTDIIQERFKEQDGLWTGLWYDPIVFAANKDTLKSMDQTPLKWADLAKENKLRLGLTDFLAADASANLLYTLLSVNGEAQTLDFFKKIHPKIVQYAKFLATPVRMAGMGEVDVAIAVQSEAIRYVNDGFPVTILYPEEGTAFYLTGAGLVSGSKQQADAKHFIDWLLQDSAQTVLQKNKFYFIPTNQETLVYKYFADKNIKLLENKQVITFEQKHQLLDKWVQNVRLNSR